MKELLEALQKEKKLCQLYWDASDTQTFGLGKILAVDDEFFAAAYVDYYGRYGGIEVSLWKNLFSVKTDTDYIAAIQKLAERRNVNLDVGFDVRDGVLISLLRRVKKENRICCLELHESDSDDVVGRISEIDEERGILTAQR